jgi:hypothetical protein
MSTGRRMAPDYRRVVVDEHGEDWNVRAEATANWPLSVAVWADGDGAMPETELRAFAAALVKAADALATENPGGVGV